MTIDQLQTDVTNAVLTSAGLIHHMSPVMQQWLESRILFLFSKNWQLSKSIFFFSVIVKTTNSSVLMFLNNNLILKIFQKQPSVIFPTFSLILPPNFEKHKLF